MQPADHQQLVIENQVPPVANPGDIIHQNPDRKLWGSKVRLFMGIFQITFGVIEVTFGIAVIYIPMYYYDSSDSFGWGIWNGAFAIVTGVLGMYSKRRKGMVIAYMVTSILAAVLSSVCAIWAGAMISNSRWRRDYRTANLASYSILCVVFALQFLMSILGGSFTCRPVCSTNNQQQVVYYYVAQAPLQQTGPVPPYVFSATPPPPEYNASPGSPPLQYDTPNGDENILPSKSEL